MLLSDIKIKSAVLENLSEINTLFEKTRKVMGEQGIDQWQDGYPFSSDIETDIAMSRAYVLIGDGKIVGYFAYTSENEPVYDNITEGAFRENGKTSAVHRVAISPELRGNGFGSLIFSYAKKLAHIDLSNAVRCDTHEDNKPMRSLLAKCGFQYCGVVYYERGDKKEKRIAFDLLI